MKLIRDFYQRDTIEVAEELLGKVLVRDDGRQRLSGLIIETEAYLGLDDPACHTFGGRRTQRVQSMYLPGGHAYVYFVYGMHYCFNVVTTETAPEAVLVRALLPLEGVRTMQNWRRVKGDPEDLTNGPGKLCQALGIDRSFDGASLVGEQIYIEEPSQARRPEKLRIEATPRVGINYAGDAAFWPLRFRLFSEIPT